MPDQPSHPVLRWYGKWERAFAEGIPEKFRWILANWLAHQRWFITKEEHAPGIEIEQAWQIQVDEHAIWWLLLHLHDETQTRRFYQLPLVWLRELDATAKVIAQMVGGQRGWLVDAWSWPPLARFVLQQMAASTGQAELAPRLVVWAEEPLEINLAATPVETDQSNTIIRFAERYFFKVFRSLTPGVQPDEEVGRYLHHRHFDYTIPPLAGLHWLLSPSPLVGEGRGGGTFIPPPKPPPPGGGGGGGGGPTLHHPHPNPPPSRGREEPRRTEQATTLALCSPFIANQGSAWSWLVEQLQSESAEIPKELAEAIELLGQRTAQLHLTLAQPTEDKAFRPVPLTLDRIRQLQNRILEKTEKTLEVLRQSVHISAIRSLVADICQKEKELQERITSWQPDEIDGVLTRIHGDYHLGQVLRTKDHDWLIIDFEGEPLRPIAERQIKDSPLRDVAGMLRSFAYARSVAQEAERPLTPGPSSFEVEGAVKDDESRLLMASEESAWQQVMAQFLQRYFSILQGQGVIPSDPYQLQRLLELYELEKVLYEIEYELKSRPQWLWIPVTGLWQFIGREAKK